MRGWFSRRRSSAVDVEGTLRDLALDHVISLIPSHAFGAERDRERRAFTLLVSTLNQAQLASFEKEFYFDVVGSSGGVWRISLGRWGNTKLYYRQLRSHARRWVTYCAGLADWSIPVGDVLLAQKLMIETDERRWRHVAIRIS